MRFVLTKIFRTGLVGAKRNRLFIAATTSIYAVYLNTKGAPRPELGRTP